MRQKNKSGDQSRLDELGIKFNITDVGNAERFEARFGKQLKYLPEEKSWLIHDGKRWTTSNAISAVSNLAVEVVKSIYEEARDCENDMGRFHLGKWAYQSQMKSKIDPMIDLLAKKLSVESNQFDTDPELVNCQNGIVNLRTAELLARTDEHLNRKLANAGYKPQAKCPQWAKFLGEVFLGDGELIQYVQKALGYSLTGHTKEHKLFLAYGLGSNGKTTLIETILELIGDYGRTAEFSNFLGSDKSDVRSKEAVGMLKGVRFATASETDSTKKWNEALLKKITGGDTLIGTHLYGKSFEFKPTHKLWFQANHLPGVKDASHGFWRRIIVIPFKAKFEGSAKVIGLKDKFLIEEREGIFAWLCEGARLYLANGLDDVPTAIAEAISAYNVESDTLGRYLSERFEDEIGGKLNLADVYSDYAEWCQANREEPTSMKWFSTAIEERGISKRRMNNGVMITGKRLRGVQSDFNGVSVEAPFHSEEPPKPNLKQARYDLRGFLERNRSGHDYGVRSHERKEIKTGEDILRAWDDE